MGNAKKFTYFKRAAEAAGDDGNDFEVDLCTEIGVDLTVDGFVTTVVSCAGEEGVFDVTAGNVVAVKMKLLLQAAIY